MNVLFIGGTGVISAACTRRAVESGYNVTLLNRGRTQRSVPPTVHVIQCDIRNRNSTATLLKNKNFDVVVNWVAFKTDHVEQDIQLFNGRTGQYIFISSASAYQKPPEQLPITETTPLSNPFWAYSRDKIACERLLFKTWREKNFPVTVVRPSHTYDETLLPFRGRYSYTFLDRMRRGKKIIIHGDGTSLWVLTHSMDFAAAFNGLIGEERAIGEAYHITSDEVLTWNKICEITAAALGVETKIEHVSSDFIAAFDPEWGASLLGDKSFCMVFDNSKIKTIVPGFSATVPFSRGAQEIVRWFDSHPAAQIVDAGFDRLVEKIILKHRAGLP
ncbi:SDR family oxidoreductase [candidate division KSB1 bacterium]|nr:SDR family oxidoreductase [candidate division KSB1 bacterium]